jgi:hypothetical protein
MTNFLRFIEVVMAQPRPRTVESGVFLPGYGTANVRISQNLFDRMR